MRFSCRIIYLLLGAVLSLLAVSCAKPEIDYRDYLLGFTADDATVTGSLDPQAIVESAGSYEPSDALDRMVYRLLKELRGVQPDAGVFTRYNEHGLGGLLLYVNDAGDVDASLKDAGFKKSGSGDYVAYMPKRPVGKGFVAHGNVLWLVDGGNAVRCVENVKAMEAKAEANPLIQWQRDRIAMPNTVNVMFRFGLKNNIAHMTIDISGLKMDINAQNLDDNGRAAKEHPDEAYRLLNQAIVETVARDAAVVLACALPEGLPYERWLGGRALSPLVGVIRDIDATVGIGVGLRDDCDGDIADFSNYAFTVAAEMKPGTADKDVAALAEILRRAGLPVVKSGNEVLVGGADEPFGKIYADDGKIMITTASQVMPRHIEIADITNLMGYVKIDILAGGPIAEMLGIDYGIQGNGVLTPTTMSLTLKLDGAEGGFVENIMRLF